MKKFMILILIYTLLLTACSTNSITTLYGNEDEIASENNSYNLNEKEQTIKDQQYKGKIEFEGMDTLWTYDAKEDEDIDITYLITVISGKVKIVLITPDKTVSTIVENTSKSELNDYATNTLHIKKGMNRIKIVAEKNTDVELDITIPNGDFQKIGM